MIDMKPAVGRIVFGEPTGDAVVGVHGRITRISGQRIVYQAQDGRERFVYKVAAVCDTDEEAKKLLVFNAEVFGRYAALRSAIAHDFAKLFGGDQ